MATAAPTQNLPLFYEALEPLNATQHGKMKVRAIPASPTMAKTHAIPLTVDEFMLVQRHYPIVFSVGDDPIPMALMGLNEGVERLPGRGWPARDPQIYLPAYLRRYPFLLARLRPDVTNCRSASTRLPMRSAISRRARRYSMAISRARRPRRS